MNKKTKGISKKNCECYNCGKKRHFARNYWQKEEGNAAVSTSHESEMEWHL